MSGRWRCASPPPRTVLLTAYYMYDASVLLRENSSRYVHFIFWQLEYHLQ